MNKSDIISKISEEVGITKKTAEKALSAFQMAVRDGLKDDGKISLIGFGSFSVLERKARKGRNPKTGDVIEIPASKSVKFTPSKALKEDIAKQEK